MSPTWQTTICFGIRGSVLIFCLLWYESYLTTDHLFRNHMKCHCFRLCLSCHEVFLTNSWNEFYLTNVHMFIIQCPTCNSISRRGVLGEVRRLYAGGCCCGGMEWRWTVTRSGADAGLLTSALTSIPESLSSSWLVSPLTCIFSYKIQITQEI